MSGDFYVLTDNTQRISMENHSMPPPGRCAKHYVASLNIKRALPDATAKALLRNPGSALTLLRRESSRR